MRIIAGRFGGRSLKGPQGRSVRPTSDRLRETMFNILAHSYGDPVAGARVVDLFAGAGALGLEAVSRGARFALLVDDGAEARALLRENVERLGLGGLTRIFRRDATRLGAAPAGEAFDLAFLDPPYGRGLAPRALAALATGGWLKPEALCVVEEGADETVSIAPPFVALERRVCGAAQIAFVRYAPSPEANDAWGGERA